MYIKTWPQNVKGTIEDLLFHVDPETRLSAATHLGHDAVGVSDQRCALEALTAALHDPCSTVQDAVLESLMRMSAKSSVPE